MAKRKKIAVITARCDEDLKRSLKEFAQIKEVDPADIIRIAVRTYIQHFNPGGANDA